MTMQIRALSVYGHNRKRRDIEFNLDGVSILIGGSKRGKTSLIDIAEYCLGSDECDVPAGTIQENVAWYALLLKFPDGEVFVARKAPKKGKKATNVAYMIAGASLDIPEFSDLAENNTIENIRDQLSWKMGVAEYETQVPTDRTRNSIKLGLKNSLYYLFQSQDEIANKRILFHRQQAHSNVSQTIKDTLPYYLGVIPDNRLAELALLRAKKRESNILSKKIHQIEAVTGGNYKQGYSILAEALKHEMSSLKEGAPDDATLLQELERIAKWQPEDKAANSDYRTIARAERDYGDLQLKKDILQSKLDEARNYQEDENGFLAAAREQKHRLKAIGLFQKFDTAKSEAVLNVNGQYDFEQMVYQSLENLNFELEGVARNPPRVTKYINDLIYKVDQVRQEQFRVRTIINRLRHSNSYSAEKARLDISRSKISGKAALFIESLQQDNDIENLRTKLMLLEGEIESLNDSLDSDAQEEDLSRVLINIADDMTRWARELNLEHSEFPVRLDLKNLTVMIDAPSGSISLGKIGSAANWVGYHIVAYLALAKWFIKYKRPVARFLILDQLSQSYFPKQDKEREESAAEIKNEDRQAVRDLFRWLFKKVQTEVQGLQLIILDHAEVNEDWFENKIIDQKWFGEAALIPKDWYE